MPNLSTNLSPSHILITINYKLVSNNPADDISYSMKKVLNAHSFNNITDELNEEIQQVISRANNFRAENESVDLLETWAIIISDRRNQEVTEHRFNSVADFLNHVHSNEELEQYSTSYSFR